MDMAVNRTLIKNIDIVIPVYKAESSLDELSARLQTAMATIGIPYSVILVEDGSPDNSWDKIVSLKRSYPFISACRLSRNFGQHAAITAGLRLSNASHVIVMDCDLQDRPEEIVELVSAANRTASEVVLARRISRQDPLIPRIGSKLFYKALSYLSGYQFDNSVANFGIYSQRTILEVLKMGDYVRFFPVMVQWVGFKSVYVDVKHDKRFEGVSTYSVLKKASLAINVMLFFSEKPLKIQVALGLCLALASLTLGLIYLFLALNHLFTITGFATLAISIFFLSGVIMFGLGVVGLYVGNIFNQVKSRSIYVVSEQI